MHGFKREMVKQKCKEFLVFSSLEVKLLVDRQYQLEQQQKSCKRDSGPTLK